MGSLDVSMDTNALLGVVEINNVEGGRNDEVIVIYRVFTRPMGVINKN